MSLLIDPAMLRIDSDGRSLIALATALAVVDTVRADAMGSRRSGDAAVLPNFRRFASEGIECTAAEAASSWT